MTFHYKIDDCGIREYKVWFKIILGLAILYGYIAIMASFLVSAEKDVGNINTYSDAFWVLQMSASTIGFGDFYPVTFWGRWIIAVSFYVGVGIAGYVGANIANIFTNFTDTDTQNKELKRQNANILENQKMFEKILQDLQEK
jgi:voltage-gated potassium channel